MIVKTADWLYVLFTVFTRWRFASSLLYSCVMAFFAAVFFFFFFFFFFFVASSAGLAKHLKFLCFPATLVLKSCSSFNTLHFLIILEKWTNSQRLEHPWSWQRYWSQLIRHATFALSCFSCSGKAQDSSQRKFFPHFFWEKIRVIS